MCQSLSTISTISSGIKLQKDELVKLEPNKKRYIFIDFYNDNSNLIIKIRDNANGIPIDNIEKIFESYFTTKEDDEGTGMWLYMCRQIIIGMNGELNVSNVEYSYENENYKGAEFIIKIPLNLDNDI